MELYIDGTLAPTPDGFAGCGFLILKDGAAFSGTKFLGRGYHSGMAEIEAALLGLEKAVELGRGGAVELKTDCLLVYNRIYEEKDQLAKYAAKPYYRTLVRITELLSEFSDVKVLLIPRDLNLADEIAQLSLLSVRDTNEWQALLGKAIQQSRDGYKKYLGRTKSQRQSKMKRRRVTRRKFESNKRKNW
jgi:ribonuclease HI